MPTTTPGDRKPPATLNTFRRILSTPALNALADFNEDLYLTLKRLISAVILTLNDISTRLLNLESAPGVTIPQVDVRAGVASGYASFVNGVVVITNSKVDPTTSRVTCTYRSFTGAQGSINVPYSGMSSGQFTVYSLDAAGATVAADQSEFAWHLINEVAE